LLKAFNNQEMGINNMTDGNDMDSLDCEVKSGGVMAGIAGAKFGTRLATLALFAGLSGLGNAGCSASNGRGAQACVEGVECDPSSLGEFEDFSYNLSKLEDDVSIWMARCDICIDSSFACDEDDISELMSIGNFVLGRMSAMYDNYRSTVESVNNSGQVDRGRLRGFSVAVNERMKKLRYDVLRSMNRLSVHSREK